MEHHREIKTLPSGTEVDTVLEAIGAITDDLHISRVGQSIGTAVDDPIAVQVLKLCISRLHRRTVNGCDAILELPYVLTCLVEVKVVNGVESV